MKKRNVTKTSKQAYKVVKQTLLSREIKLYKFLLEDTLKVGLTANDAALLLNIPRNEAAKRLSSLQARGLIKRVATTVLSSSKRRVSIYGIA
jgi:predicted transcriptional regulator